MRFDQSFFLDFLRDDPILFWIIIWHGLLISLLVVLPQHWLLVILFMFGSHIIILLACILIASPWPGHGIRQIPATEQATIYLTFDDGPNPEITPQIMAMLNQNNATASFFTIGAKVEMHPDIIHELAQSGHKIENHSWSHPAYFFFLPWSQLRDQVDKASVAIVAVTGRAPNYFRAPAGIRSPLLQLLLAHLGLRLAAWSKRGFDTVTKDATKIEKRMLKNLHAGDILLLHDGSSAVDQDNQKVVLIVLSRILDYCQQQGLHVSHLPTISTTISK